jgi:hypothetical protein
MENMKKCIAGILEFDDKLTQRESSENVFIFQNLRSLNLKNNIILNINFKFDGIEYIVKNVDSFNYFDVIIPNYLKIVSALLLGDVNKTEQKQLCFNSSIVDEEQDKDIEKDKIIIEEEEDDDEQELLDADMEGIFSYKDEGGLDDILGDDYDESGNQSGNESSDEFDINLDELSQVNEDDDKDENEDEDDELDINLDELSQVEEDDNEEDDKDEEDINLSDLSAVSDEESGDEDGKEKSGGERKIWVNRIQERDDIFKVDKFKSPTQAYSKTCPSNQNRQPVILTKDEWDEIKDNESHHPIKDKYEFNEETKDKNKVIPEKERFSVKFHSKTGDEHYYICPKFWCIDKNRPINILNELEMKEENGRKVLKRNEKGEVISKPGVCSNIHEFGVKYSQTKDKDGENIIDKTGTKLKEGAFNYPSFKDDDYCLPCCFKYSDKRQPANFIKSQERANNCMKKAGVEIDKKEGDQDILRVDNTEKDIDIETEPQNKKLLNTSNRLISVILQSDKFPLPENRAGYLNVVLQEIFSSGIKNMNCDSTIIPFNCFLRMGVEKSENQSFISAMAYVHSVFNNSSYLHSLVEFKELIIKSINIDHYIKFQNGNLVSLFYDKSKTIDNYDDDVKVSLIYTNMVDSKDVMKKKLFDRIYNSYLTFKEYLKNDDNLLDHTLLWDLMCHENRNIFINGINLVIFEISSKEDENYINILCPSNYYTTSKFDENKTTVFLVKMEQYYEPIMNIVKQRKASKPSINFLKPSGVSGKFNINKILTKVHRYYNECYPIPSIPSLYNYKSDINKDDYTLRLKDDIHKFLKTSGDKYKNIKMVLNVNGKVVGLYCETKEGLKGVIPCYPSYYDVENEKSIVFYNDKSIYSSYENTIKFLKNIQDNSNKRIILLKKTENGNNFFSTRNVIKEDKIIGIVTPLNHIIQINPPILKKSIDRKKYSYDDTNIMFLNNEDEYMDAVVLDIMDEEDKKRKLFVRKLKLENISFMMFRHKLKTLLENPKLIEEKNKLIMIIREEEMSYSEKLKEIEDILKKIIKEGEDYILIDKFSDEYMETINIDDIPNDVLQEESDIINISRKNLLSGKENISGYFKRISDELIRFPSLSKYILDPKGYIESINSDYSQTPNEVIYPESMITKQMLSNIERWSSLTHPHEISFDTKQPIKTPRSVVRKQSDDWINSKITIHGGSNKSKIVLKPESYVKNTMILRKKNGGIRKTKRFILTDRIFTRKNKMKR